jgi:hypothetical protein
MTVPLEVLAAVARFEPNINPTQLALVGIWGRTTCRAQGDALDIRWLVVVLLSALGAILLVEGEVAWFAPPATRGDDIPRVHGTLPPWGAVGVGDRETWGGGAGEHRGWNHCLRGTGGGLGSTHHPGAARGGQEPLPLAIDFHLHTTMNVTLHHHTLYPIGLPLGAGTCPGDQLAPYQLARQKPEIHGWGAVGRLPEVQIVQMPCSLHRAQPGWASNQWVHRETGEEGIGHNTMGDWDGDGVEEVL